MIRVSWSAILARLATTRSVVPCTRLLGLAPGVHHPPSMSKTTLAALRAEVARTLAAYDAVNVPSRWFTHAHEICAACKAWVAAWQALRSALKTA